ncbi:MAG: VanZ family protein [Clostridia bacterium]|nr:VanZ family protein [Clostridia bacterium]
MRIYGSDGFLFYGLFLTFSLSSKKQIIFAGILGIMYAISDEIHQTFVPRKSSDKYKMF